MKTNLNVLIKYYLGVGLNIFGIVGILLSKEPELLFLSILMLYSGNLFLLDYRVSSIEQLIINVKKEVENEKINS